MIGCPRIVRVCCIVCATLPGCAAKGPPSFEQTVYRNDFNGPVGASFAEWTSSPISFHKSVSGISGEFSAPVLTTTQAPNKERFLGLFGGPPIGRPGDRDWQRTRVDQTITLSLDHVPPHHVVVVSFELYIIRSWDGSSPQYGLDILSLRAQGGPTLLHASFSNNPKIQSDGSEQSYPDSLESGKLHPPQSGAANVGTLGYDSFFKDSIYTMHYTFPHEGPSLRLHWSSSLFEGKGTEDEAWGLDNVVVTVR